MSYMTFMPELKDYLKKNGSIYTVRRYKMVDTMVEIDGIGECHRIPMGSISSSFDLEPYYKESGFDTLDAWWTKIKHFIPQPGAEKYLYKVEVSSGK